MSHGRNGWVKDADGPSEFSFPLYAKGVEKYRYEYAVFLLNKNIELVSPLVT